MELIAAVAKALVEMAVNANIISAYYYDPIFVTFDRAADALTCLKTVSVSEQKQTVLTSREGVSKHRLSA